MIHVHVVHVSIMLNSACVHNAGSRISAYGHLNITCDFGPHGRLPGIKNPHIYNIIEAATLTYFEIGYMGTFPGHYDTYINIMITFRFTQSFNRTNLQYSVIPKKPKKVIQDIIELINRSFRGQSGVIYCLSR